MIEWCCAGVVLGALGAAWVPVRALPWAVLAGLGLLGLGALDLRQRVAWGAAGLLLGAVAVAGQPEGPALEGQVVVQGVVVGGGLGRSADVACSRWARAAGQWRACSGRVRVRFRGHSPGPGTGVLVRGEARSIEGASGVLPGAPDPVWQARRGRVRAVVKAERVQRIGAGLERECAVDDPTGVLCAVATGVRDGLDRELVDTLRDTGTAHVLAISGFHVGVVALVAGSVAGGLLRLVALVRPEGLSRAPAWIAGVAAAMGYAWVAGAPTSAQRAALLLALGVVVKLRGGEVHPLRLLGLVAVAVVLVDPPAVGSAAFQLSFGALVGILRVTPRLERYIPPDLPGFVDRGLRGMAASIAATVGTLPACAWWFQTLPPASPLANLVALPWCAVGVVPPAAVAAFGPEPLASWAAWAGSGSVRAMLAVLEPLAVQPLAPAVGPLGALALGCWTLWPRRVGGCALITWLALGLTAAPAGDRITLLDVGQGDAALAEVDGRVWLIDGGRPSRRVLHWLRRRGIRRVDVVVATHEQDDHTGGLIPVLEELEVGELWVSMDGPTASVARARGIPVVYRHPFALHPPMGFTAEDPNDLSLVVELGGVLFTGDIEQAGEQLTWARVGHPVPVLKVPHHGSPSSSSELLLNAVQPTVAIIGVGADNWYGHPDPDVLERYLERGIAVYRTDVDGTIEVSVREEEVHVRTWRPGRGWSPMARHRIQAAADSSPAGTASVRPPRRLPTASTTSPASATPTETPWL